MNTSNHSLPTRGTPLTNVSGKQYRRQERQQNEVNNIGSTPLPVFSTFSLSSSSSPAVSSASPPCSSLHVSSPSSPSPTSSSPSSPALRSSLYDSLGRNSFALEDVRLSRSDHDFVGFPSIVPTMYGTAQENIGYRRQPQHQRYLTLF
eukprot:GHVT01090388.1.p2 GENE.GHVT01090388.1~~GHVT01090388.1.p2  ORF type:complete len:148 (+),score=25.17 GHVT01090388.1:2140-2583(+)